MAVTALLACQPGGGETSTTTDPETTESSDPLGSGGMTTDGSLTEGDSVQSSSSIMMNRSIGAPALLSSHPPCDHLDIGCLMER